MSSGLAADGGDISSLEGIPAMPLAHDWSAYRWGDARSGRRQRPAMS
jgi:hypothetical protein